MENWCYYRYNLFDLSKHNKPNEKDTLFQVHDRGL